MEFEPAVAPEEDLDLGQDEAILDEGEGPQPTAEPAAAGNAGDPLETLRKFHPESILRYAESVMPLVRIQQAPPTIADPEDVEATTNRVDPHHKTQPFLTVYEKTKILGTRANQLAQGARPFIVVPDHVIAPLEIAKMELEQRRLPFIVERPMPDGTFEYWSLSDMMLI